MEERGGWELLEAVADLARDVAEQERQISELERKARERERARDGAQHSGAR